MFTFITWLQWMLTKETVFHGLTLENLNKLAYTINGPDYSGAIVLDVTFIGVAILLVMYRIFTRSDSSKDEA